MMKLITQFIVCLLLTLPLVVVAGDEGLAILKLLRQSPGIENRKALASQLLLHWERIDKSIPRLSPDEKKWLEKEMQSDRKFWDRREFAQQEALFKVEKLLFALKAIAKPNNIKEEIGNWVLASRELSDRDLYVYLSGLVKLGVIPPPPHTNISDEIPVFYLAVSEHILNIIILGYFFDNEALSLTSDARVVGQLEFK